MKTIKVDGDFEVMMADMKANIPRIIEQAKRAGLKLNLEIWPTEEEFRAVLASPKHRLFEKYYGTADYMHVYNVLEGIIDDPAVKEKGATFLTNWAGSRGRQKNANPMQEVIGWGTNYDPVSKLILLAAIAAKADSEAFCYSNEDRNWLEHNCGYYKKIGYTSQYFPDVLRKAEADYGRTESITLSDNDVEFLVNAAKVIQMSIGDMRCEPYAIEDVMDRALDRNNKSAESAPGFRNLKHDSVKADVLEDAIFIRDNCDYTDLQLMNEQKRIQSGGNVLFDKYYPIKLDDNGRIVFNVPEVIAAVHQIAAERGYFTAYYEEEPVVLPDLISAVVIKALPSSESERKKMVDAGAPEFLLRRDKLTKEWTFNYELKLPQVFTTVGDKYPDLVDIAGEVFTKHRSIKAAMGSYSKVGQSYLYSFLDKYKEKLMHFDNPFYSLVAQWSHPDDLKTMITASAVAAFPEIYEGLDVSVPYSQEDLEKFISYRDKGGFEPKMSSDDKTGFDMVQKIYTTFLFYCAYFSIPFEMNEQNIRLFKMFIINDCMSVVSCIDDITMYFEIIGSGQWNTSIKGTYASNTASIVMRQKFADPNTPCVISESSDNTNVSDNEDTGGDIDEYLG